MTSKALLVGLLTLAVTACTTTDQAREKSDRWEEPRQPVPTRKRIKPVDLVKLSKKLGMYKDVTDVGFYERTFNDCSLPREHRLSNGCSTQILTAIQFRTRCRDSEGTVESVTNFELEPMVASAVKWNLGRHSGTTPTNTSGYGRILVRSARSLRNERFRLTHNNQMMAVTAAEVRQFVLPRYWCR